MDNNINNLPSSAHNQEKKSTKKPNKTKKSINKQKPVKVVYISNPMKVKTSISEFRALVQELTGQDAEFPDPTKFPATDDEDYGYTGSEDPTAKMGSEDHDEGRDHDREEVVVESSTTTTTPNTASYEMFDDDVFMPQMMDSLSGIFPSTVWYDSPQLDVIRSASLDASCDVN
ncbi:sigma factor binding protein 1, chloroplastic-like [Humulus lupulus]|uniref:sigma factor binding protein 1, chloroplastic-like n=1 Tax=Humulus lupulus TaxID=3486 RepID=UPI002B40ACC2|nr:sigma factor binding protein 1, chloroplastic-like [Humulus lupulus]